LEPHDLVLAKCVAGRDRDWEFARDAIPADLVQVDELLARVPDLPRPRSDRDHLHKMLLGLVAQLEKHGTGA
jgi:hypothetical protein